MKADLKHILLKSNNKGGVSPRKGEIMTIAQTEKEIKGLVKEHHIYGAETIINALVRSSKDISYLDEETIVKMVKSAFERIGDE